MPLDKAQKYRLIRYVTFLETEIGDYQLFTGMTREEYVHNRSRRRDVERWIENQINVSVDIAKVILIIENITIPDTYREIITNLSLVPAFKKETIERLSHWVRLRNIISHEYLDVKWESIRKFIIDSPVLCNDFLQAVKNYMSGKEKKM